MPFPIHGCSSDACILLAGYLVQYHAEPNVSKIDTFLDMLSLPKAEEGDCARYLLRHYEDIFPSHSPENALLRCIGLFDATFTGASVNAVTQSPAIGGRTDSLMGLGEVDQTSMLRKFNRLSLVE